MVLLGRPSVTQDEADTTDERGAKLGRLGDGALEQASASDFCAEGLLMPSTGPVPWERAEHTAAKHDIYGRYLRRWFPIILSENSWSRATYVEGFAGPGVYEQGEEGSPIIALRAFLEEVPSENKTAGFVLIDDDRRCIDRLRIELTKAFPERPRPEGQMPVNIRHGKCEELLEHELDDMGAWGTPILAVLDSWGNVPVSYRLLRRIAQNIGSEVLVTLEPQHFVRFVSTLGEDVDAVFGDDPTWRDAANLPSSDKRRHILQCYRNSLSRAGFEYLLDFELVDRRGNTIYLVFGTNHRRGVEKMKDSLWEVDRAHGVGFRDPKDQQDEALFDIDEIEVQDAQLAPLARLLLAHLHRTDEYCRVETLREYTLFETVFRPEHVIRALRPLLDSGRIDLQEGGRNIRRASFVKASSQENSGGSDRTIPEPRATKSPIGHHEHAQ